MSEPFVRYELRALTTVELQEEIDAALNSEEFLASEAELLGVAPSDLRAVEFRVEAEGGFVAEGIIVGIIVGTTSNLATDAIKALWKSIAKRIRDRRGNDSLGEDEDDNEG